MPRAKRVAEDVEEIEATDAPEAPGDAPVTQNDLARAIQALAQSQQRLADSAPVVQVPLAKFKAVTGFNPRGLPESHPERTLKRRCFQNGGEPINSAMLTDEEIKLFNEAKPGRYFNGKVIFREERRGRHTNFHVEYDCKTVDQRFLHKGLWMDLPTLLKHCAAQYAAGQHQAV